MDIRTVTAETSQPVEDPRIVTSATELPALLNYRRDRIARTIEPDPFQAPSCHHWEMYGSFRLPQYTVLGGRKLPDQPGRIEITVPPLLRPDAERIRRHLPVALRVLTQGEPNPAELANGLRAVDGLQLAFERIGCAVLAGKTVRTSDMARALGLAAAEAESAMDRWLVYSGEIGDFYTSSKADLTEPVLVVDLPGRSATTAQALAVCGIELFGSLANRELDLAAEDSAAVLGAAYNGDIAARRAGYDLAMSTTSYGRLMNAAQSLETTPEAIIERKRNYVPSVAPFRQQGTLSATGVDPRSALRRGVRGTGRRAG